MGDHGDLEGSSATLQQTRQRLHDLEALTRRVQEENRLLEQELLSEAQEADALATAVAGSEARRAAEHVQMQAALARLLDRQPQPEPPSRLAQSTAALSHLLQASRASRPAPTAGPLRGQPVPPPPNPNEGPMRSFAAERAATQRDVERSLAYLTEQQRQIEELAAVVDQMRLQGEHAAGDEAQAAVDSLRASMKGLSDWCQSLQEELLSLGAPGMGQRAAAARAQPRAGAAPPPAERTGSRDAAIAARMRAAMQERGVPGAARAGEVDAGAAEDVIRFLAGVLGGEGGPLQGRGDCGGQAGREAGRPGLDGSVRVGSLADGLADLGAVRGPGVARPDGAGAGAGAGAPGPRLPVGPWPAAEVPWAAAGVDASSDEDANGDMNDVDGEVEEEEEGSSEFGASSVTTTAMRRLLEENRRLRGMVVELQSRYARSLRRQRRLQRALFQALAPSQPGLPGLPARPPQSPDRDLTAADEAWDPRVPAARQVAARPAWADGWGASDGSQGVGGAVTLASEAAREQRRAGHGATDGSARPAAAPRPPLWRAAAAANGGVPYVELEDDAEGEAWAQPGEHKHRAAHDSGRPRGKPARPQPRAWSSGESSQGDVLSDPSSPVPAEVKARMQAFGGDEGLGRPQSAVPGDLRRAQERSAPPEVVAFARRLAGDEGYGRPWSAAAGQRKAAMWMPVPEHVLQVAQRYAGDEGIGRPKTAVGGRRR